MSYCHYCDPELKARIAELEAELGKFKSVGWGIWYKEKKSLSKFKFQKKGDYTIFDSESQARKRMDDCWMVMRPDAFIPIELFRKEGEGDKK